MEGPSGRGRVEQILAELVGRSVRVTSRLADEAAGSSPQPTAPLRGRTTAKDKQRPAEIPDGDAFVLRAASLFEAKVLKVTELGGPAGD